MKKIIAMMLALMMVLSMTACGAKPQGTEPPAAAMATGVEDGVLTVGMECAYAPNNWTQMNDSNGAVPIVNNPGSYANGYDVMIAKRICQAYGWKLEVMAIEWNGLTPALNAGTIDAVIAGQSMTPERLAEVDMAGPYLYASIVCVAKEGTAQAAATGISSLTGTCTSQTGTIWYDTCLPQIPGAEIMPESESASAMIMAVVSGTVDFICTDMPTAMGACSTYDGLVILDFTGSNDDFAVDAGDINIGISVTKGNRVTAANASGINDGAAALVLASKEAVEKYGLKPMAKLVSWGQGGVDPKVMGLGPVPASRQALAKAELTIEDIDLVEANEAFAAQSVAVARDLEFDMSKVNVNGGAISIGHPVGCSGARIIVTLLHEMQKRDDAKKGLATLCIGGGMGVATIWEKC